MRLCQYGSKVLNIGAIAYADLSLPTPDSDNDWVELVIHFLGGGSTVLYSDEALLAWKSLQLYSINMSAPRFPQAS